MVRLVETGGSLTRRLKRSLRCLLAELTWQINEQNCKPYLLNNCLQLSSRHSFCVCRHNRVLSNEIHLLYQCLSLFGAFVYATPQSIASVTKFHCFQSLVEDLRTSFLLHQVSALSIKFSRNSYTFNGHTSFEFQTSP